MAEYGGRGLVLGAGGMLGAAWMTARLHAIEAAGAPPVHASEVIVGSSAGSVLAALLSVGVSVGQLLGHQQGDESPDNPLTASGFDYESSVGGALPERPPIRLGSSALLRAVARHPRQLGLLTGVAAALPPGRGSLDDLRRAVTAIVEASGRAVDEWPDRLRVVAMDYDSGARVVFGAPGAPAASIPDAVQASCSIPGWFAPTVIGRRRYVDAGFRQATSADVLVGRGLAVVRVLAPLAEATGEPRPDSRIGRLERRFRRHLTRVLEREIDALRADGTVVEVYTPTLAERALMGVNLMDPARRRAVLDVALRTGAAEAG